MENYYVYCKNLLAVKTSINNFRWVFGRNAPNVEQSEFERCLVKLNVSVDDDRKISAQCDSEMQRFGDYYGTVGGNQIIFNKKKSCWDSLHSRFKFMRTQSTLLLASDTSDSYN